MFKDQIRHNMEVYVYNLLVNSRTPKRHLTNLCEALAVLRHYHIKLNPVKCAFGVEFGKFWVYGLKTKDKTQIDLIVDST